MKKYIDFEILNRSKRLTPNIINTYFEYIDKYLVKSKLDDKSILSEVKLYYEVK